MTLNTTNNGDPNDGSAVEENFQEIVGAGCHSGFGLTYNGNTTVNIASGIYIDGVGVFRTYAGGTVDLTNANGANPRIDLLQATTAGTVTVLNGTAAANPIPPTLSANAVMVAAFWRAAADNVIDATDTINRFQGRVKMAHIPAVSGGSNYLVVPSSLTTSFLNAVVMFNAPQNANSYTYRIRTSAGISENQGIFISPGGAVSANTGNIRPSDVVAGESFVIEQVNGCSITGCTVFYLSDD